MGQRRTGQNGTETNGNHEGGDCSISDDLFCSSVGLTFPCPHYNSPISPLGLAYVLMLGQISPEIVLFPGFKFSNIPRYFHFTSTSRIVAINTQCLDFYQDYKHP